jgi:hypothetical protein
MALAQHHAFASWLRLLASGRGVKALFHAAGAQAQVCKIFFEIRLDPRHHARSLRMPDSALWIPHSAFT